MKINVGEVEVSDEIWEKIKNSEYGKMAAQLGQILYNSYTGSDIVYCTCGRCRCREKEGKTKYFKTPEYSENSVETTLRKIENFLFREAYLKSSK